MAKALPAIEELSALLADRVRLTIMAALAAEPEPLAFATLASRLGLTNGNLSSHLRRLEEAGLVLVSKQFVERKPLTTLAVTPIGRAELERYLRAVERLLAAAMQGAG
jgi:DNA-binding MarR family transcriptional regulator